MRSTDDRRAFLSIQFGSTSRARRTGIGAVRRDRGLQCFEGEAARDAVRAGIELPDRISIQAGFPPRSESHQASEKIKKME